MIFSSSASHSLEGTLSDFRSHTRKSLLSIPESLPRQIVRPLPRQIVGVPHQHELGFGVTEERGRRWRGDGTSRSREVVAEPGVERAVARGGLAPAVVAAPYVKLVFWGLGWRRWGSSGEVPGYRGGCGNGGGWRRDGAARQRWHRHGHRQRVGGARGVGRQRTTQTEEPEDDEDDEGGRGWRSRRLKKVTVAHSA
jgi:hypothetical protein